VGFGYQKRLKDRGGGGGGAAVGEKKGCPRGGRVTTTGQQGERGKKKRLVGTSRENGQLTVEKPFYKKRSRSSGS